MQKSYLHTNMFSTLSEVLRVVGRSKPYFYNVFLDRPIMHWRLNMLMVMTLTLIASYASQSWSFIEVVVN